MLVFNDTQPVEPGSAYGAYAANEPPERTIPQALGYLSAGVGAYDLRYRPCSSVEPCILAPVVLVGAAGPEGVHEGHGEHFANGDDDGGEQGEGEPAGKEIEHYEGECAKEGAHHNEAHVAGALLEGVDEGHLADGDDKAIERHGAANEVGREVELLLEEYRYGSKQLEEAGAKKNGKDHEQHKGLIGIGGVGGDFFGFLFMGGCGTVAGG